MKWPFLKFAARASTIFLVILAVCSSLNSTALAVAQLDPNDASILNSAPWYVPQGIDASVCAAAAGGGTQELEGHKLPAYTGGTGDEAPIEPDGTIPGGGSVSFANLVSGMSPDQSKVYRDYSINMRWTAWKWDWNGDNEVNDADSSQAAWLAQKIRLVMVTNPQNGKSIIAAILESGPAPWTGTHEGQGNPPAYWQGYVDGTPDGYKGRVSGLTPAAQYALGGPQIQRMDGGGPDQTGPDLIYSWAPDQSATPGPVSGSVATDASATTSSDTASAASTGTPGSGCCPTDTGTTTVDGAPPDFIKMYSGPYASDSQAISHGDLPKDQINTLIIHYTEGDSEGADLLHYFATSPASVSQGTLGVQFNIGETGKVYQYFPLDDMQKAYHVGAENSHAIGIEISGADGVALMNNQVQFNAVVKTASYLCSYYKIPCGDPKGDITGSTAADAQGLLGHSEAPDNDHSDPDTQILSNQQQINITTGQPWTAADRQDSSVHAYMMKLRTAMGLNPTPGSKSATSTTTTDTTTTTPAAAAPADTCSGGGGSSGGQDPVGQGPNQALAAAAVKYNTATNPQYKYVYGAGHGTTAQLNAFAATGAGGIDCSGFVRLIIWKVYGFDVGPTAAQDFVNTAYFKKIDPSQVQAGDMGVIDNSTDQHIDFITANLGGGNLHDFGAHDAQTNLHGGDVPASQYTYFIRYVGPQI